LALDRRLGLPAARSLGLGVVRAIFPLKQLLKIFCRKCGPRCMPCSGADSARRSGICRDPKEVQDILPVLRGGRRLATFGDQTAGWILLLEELLKFDNPFVVAPEVARLNRGLQVCGDADLSAQSHCGIS
jgi:hypothetical protein